MVKFTMMISNRKVLFTAEQVEALATVLADCEVINVQWVGSGKGDNGTDYTNRLATGPVSDLLDMKVMPETEYNAIKFFTAVA